MQRKRIWLADRFSEQGFHLAVPVNHEATKSTKTDHFQIENELRETSCSSCLRGLKSFLLGLDDMVTPAERGFGARAETIDQPPHVLGFLALVPRVVHHHDGCSIAGAE